MARKVGTARIRRSRSAASFSFAARAGKKKPITTPKKRRSGPWRPAQASTEFVACCFSER